MKKNQIFLTVISIILVFVTSSCSYAKKESKAPLNAQSNNEFEKNADVNQDKKTLLELNAQDFKKLLEDSEKKLVIDLSTEGEYKEGHIKGSIHIDKNLLDSPDRIEVLKKLGAEKNTKILIICSTGNKSRRIGQILVDDGFETVYNLLGGTTAWLKSGFELVRD